jgi:tRNA(Ile)-lysidine synthase
VSEFLRRVETTVLQRHLLAPGQSFLVAVSGGVDSMVLLHALNALAGKLRWRITVAHFNHHLRGRASEADAELVRTTAARLHWPFVAGGAEVRRLAAQSKLSLEMAARKSRHEFLARAARELGISTIALAHHADDQVELFFLRLLRGAGGEGLAGMKGSSRSPADPTVLLVRPLLDFSKAELKSYARANRIRFREDATNISTDFLRNRIRRQLLPLLRKRYQPGLDQAVLRMMDIVGAETEFVGETAKRFCAGRGGQALTAPRSSKAPAEAHPLRQERSRGDFARLALAIQRKVMQQQLAGFGVPPTFELIERLRLAPNKAVSVGVGLFALRDASGMISVQESAANHFQAARLDVKLVGQKGSAEFDGRQFRWQVRPLRRLTLPRKSRTGGRRPARGREYFDADKVGVDLVLRHWRPGDRFQPIGMPTTVKLQDLFVNAKIPPARRRELVLAATKAGVIFWVQDLRIGERFKLGPETRRKLIWEFPND